MRWDSNRVILPSVEIQAMANELVCGGLVGRMHLDLDYFDAAVSRRATWVIGARSMPKALLRPCRSRWIV